MLWHPAGSEVPADDAAPHAKNSVDMAAAGTAVHVPELEVKMPPTFDTPVTTGAEVLTGTD
jgi:hypothetical protein